MIVEPKKFLNVDHDQHRIDKHKELLEELESVRTLVDILAEKFSDQGIIATTVFSSAIATETINLTTAMNSVANTVELLVNLHKIQIYNTDKCS